tara:strand:- start:65 stop:1054 length:990 start_codon:yes stop_codon:yes gene_type:complete
MMLLTTSTSVYIPLLILFSAYLQYTVAGDTFLSPLAEDATTTTSISPVGLSLGILAVAFVQVFLTLPYYWMLRHNVLQRPFIQKKRPLQQKPFWSGLVAHLSRAEGFVLLGGYLCGTWMFGLMPLSYYDLNRRALCMETVVDVGIQLLLNDFYQTLAHLLEHQVARIYKKAHKPHHKFISPELFDAFDGNYADTICMILVPLYTTCMTLSLFRNVSVWSYMIFGATYANYLCLIHSEYEHVFDFALRKVGIATAADHHVHHRLFNYNFGHLFTYWDRLFGTYKSPLDYPQYFTMAKGALQRPTESSKRSDDDSDPKSSKGTDGTYYTKE